MVDDADDGSFVNAVDDLFLFVMVDEDDCCFSTLAMEEAQTMPTYLPFSTTA